MPAEEHINFSHYHTGFPEPVSGGIIVERPVTLFVNGLQWLTFMCTPVDLEALAIGFLFTEGVLDSKEDLPEVMVHPDGHMVEVWVAGDVAKPENWRFTSGCAGGLVSADKTIPKLSVSPAVITPEQITAISTAILEHKGLHESVGGVHTSGLFAETEAMFICEDIGRHNTMDKLAGRMFLEGISGERKIIATSGRVSSEMLQKAAVMQVGVVVSRTSPTSLSIQLAGEYRVTLIGYARGKTFNVYTCPERIASS